VPGVPGLQGGACCERVGAGTRCTRLQGGTNCEMGRRGVPCASAMFKIHLENSGSQQIVSSHKMEENTLWCLDGTCTHGRSL
jgi:hypothetical protein